MLGYNFTAITGNKYFLTSKSKKSLQAGIKFNTAALNSTLLTESNV